MQNYTETQWDLLTLAVCVCVCVRLCRAHLVSVSVSCVLFAQAMECSKWQLLWLLLTLPLRRAAYGSASRFLTQLDAALTNSISFHYFSVKQFEVFQFLLPLPLPFIPMYLNAKSLQFSTSLLLILLRVITL